jgi:hypothetical protein
VAAGGPQSLQSRLPPLDDGLRLHADLRAKFDKDCLRLERPLAISQSIAAN